MKKIYTFLSTFLIVLAVSVIWHKGLFFELNAEEPLSYETILITAPKGVITAEIANDHIKHTKGLGDRKYLSDGKGMLFTYKTPNMASMWMKGMHFPIDIIWLNSDKKVTLVKSNLSPNTYGPTEAVVYFSSYADTLFVLELPADNAKKYGIKEGVILSFEL